MWKLYRRLAMVGGLGALSAAAAVAAQPAPVPTAAQEQGHSLLTALPPASLGSPCLRPKEAFLRARIRGAVRLDVDLHGKGLTCEGEPRLDGSGIRMGFEGRVRRVGRVRMIFGIDGAKEGRAGRELPTNLTVFFEDKKLLFATQGDGNCTVDRLTQEPVSAGRARTRPRRAAAQRHMLQSTTATANSAKARTYRVVAHGF
ncbi:MAG: hypothetical protein ACRES6_09675, partial [Steroidobacteraceae bacterium]